MRESCCWTHITEEETEAHGESVVYPESKASTPSPPHPTPQLPEGCEGGNLEPGPHQQGSLRQPVPDLGPPALSWYQPRAAGSWWGASVDWEARGTHGGGNCLGTWRPSCRVATTGCDAGVRGRREAQGDTGVRGGRRGRALGTFHTLKIPH